MLPELWSLNCRNLHFMQFCADLSQKCKSVKVIYIYGSESSYCSLSEIHMVCRGLSHRSWDISNQNIKSDADSAMLSPFRCIYVLNSFDILRFFCWGQHKIEKALFRQFKDNNSGRVHENYTNYPIFSSIFCSNCL